MDILIFRTSVNKSKQLKTVGKLFNHCSQIVKWNIDMEDWEKVLRIESNCITPQEVIQMLRNVNVFASEML